MTTRRMKHRPLRRAERETARQSAPPRKKRGLTARQMLRVTDSKVLDKALSVSTSSARIGQERSGIIQARGRARDAGVTHQWKVRLKSPLFKTLWCSCSCEYFLFHCEFALTQHGASSIINSNGEPPVVTNPRMIPKVCKHVAAVLEGGITDRLVASAKKARAKARG